MGFELTTLDPSPNMLVNLFKSSLLRQNSFISPDLFLIAGGNEEN